MKEKFLNEKEKEKVLHSIYDLLNESAYDGRRGVKLHLTRETNEQLRITLYYGDTAKTKKLILENNCKMKELGRTICKEYPYAFKKIKKRKGSDSISVF